MTQPQNIKSPPTYSAEELTRISMQVMADLARHYEPGKNRVITPENVYQPAVTDGREILETFMDQLLLDGSAVQGLEHLDHCLGELEAGRNILFLPDHRGNLDVPAFNTLLRREHPRYQRILDSLIYIAGRKLNESSDFIKMFSEKYSRLVIVPKRDYPRKIPGETPEQAAEREAFDKYAAPINRSAFREMIRLKKQGMIFVLFPLGGRFKPGQDNIPVKETTSYLNGYDTAYLISMQGNPLPVMERMEDERPIQDKVVYRVGPPLKCKAFLAAEKTRFEQLAEAGKVPEEMDFEFHTVTRIMEMLDELRETGRYATP